MIFDGLFQHFFKLGDGIVDVVLCGRFGIYLLHSLFLFRIVEPVVYGAGEVFGVAGFEQTAFVKGELLGGGKGTVGDDRHLSSGESLNAGDGL